MHRLGLFQVAHQNPASPEHDIMGAGLVPFTYRGCQFYKLAALFYLV